MNGSQLVKSGSLLYRIGGQNEKETGFPRVLNFLCYILVLFIVQTICLQGRRRQIFKTIARKFRYIAESFPHSFDSSIWYTFTDIAILALIALCIWRQRHALGELFWKGSAKFLWWFALCILISIFTSSIPHFFLPYVRLLQLSFLILFFCAIANGLSLTHFQSFLFWVCGTIVVFALVECSLGIYQCLMLTTPEQMQGVDLYPSTISSGGSHALFDYFASGPRSVLLRAYGTFNHPNVFGGFLVFSNLISNYLFFSLRKRIVKIGILCAIVVELLGLTCTFSRSAFLALLLITPLWFFLCWRGAAKTQRKNLMQLGIFLLSIFLLCCVLFAKPLLERGPMFNVAKILKTEGERLKFQHIAYNMIQSSPWTGIGYHHYLVLMNKYWPEPLTTSEFLPVHNVYLFIAAETGLMGLFAFCCFIGSLFRNAHMRTISASGATFLCALIGLLFIGFCDYYPIGSRQGSILFFVIAGFLALEGRFRNETISV
jgi:O-antigen ligase